jgi:diguanylate cyclase (GGDEF)-like protein
LALDVHFDLIRPSLCPAFFFMMLKVFAQQIAAVNSPAPRLGARTRKFAIFNKPGFMAVLFGVLFSAQVIGFLSLGTGRSGQALSESILVLHNLLAFACAWVAFRRAKGITALFWCLLAAVVVILLVPTAIQVHDTLYEPDLLSDSNRGLLYCLYGAPILMMLFLPETYQHARVKSEIMLDLFQVAIVVGLIYSTFFFLPVQQMLPADALLRNVSISDVQSLLLLIAAFVRLQFARTAGNRSLFLRLAIFLLVCAVVTFVGDWFNLHLGPSAVAWFDLGWALPVVAAGLIALTWNPSSDPQFDPQLPSFLSFLGTNLVLVAMLSCIALLLDRWKQAYGANLANAAIAASLLAFTLRLALTQFHQQQEITRRQAAQRQLTVSNQEVGRLLDISHRQTSEIMQISELGSILQACASQEEVFRLVPERLSLLFPGGSGRISLLSASKNRVETAAEWGTSHADRSFAPDACWALRRGCAHIHPGGHKGPRCSHLRSEGASVCIPLIASGETIGTLSIQDDEPLSPIPDPDSDIFARRSQLASAVVERLALAVANLNLRESLRLQAVRDPLTGLYNRRYMQEFLEHALHSAQRRRRPLAVMMLDIDHFKQYNDTYGHAAGDTALAAVGETLVLCVRAEDVACRYGGEEFALILPECSLQQATVRAEEIRNRLKAYRPKPGQRPSELSVSIGVAAFDESTDRVDLLLKFADDALYQAKRSGRDRVVVARSVAALPEFSGTDSVAFVSPKTT